MKETKNFLGIIAIISVITLGMTACASLTIASVDWDSLTGPEKTRQYIGISTQQVTVYATYKDESRKEVSFFTVTHDKDNTGVQTVTVKVLGQEGTGTFQTEVMELTGIRITRTPSKTTYTIGEKPDTSGIIVMGSWRDLPDQQIYNHQLTATLDTSTAGSRNVTVNFNGKTTTYPVTVVASSSNTTTPVPTTTTPGTQQPSQQPAANQPSPVGRWWALNASGGNEYYTFNADGTGFSESDRYGGKVEKSNFTWTVSGNRLTMTNLRADGTVFNTLNYTYSISGNTITWLQEGQAEHWRSTYTRR